MSVDDLKKSVSYLIPSLRRNVHAHRLR
jgi:hypothetical protein